LNCVAKLPKLAAPLPWRYRDSPAPTVPLGLRERAAEPAPCAVKLGELVVRQKTHPAPLRARCAASGRARRSRIVPIHWRLPGNDGLRTVRVVQIEDARLHEHVGTPSVAGCCGLPSILVGGLRGFPPAWEAHRPPAAWPWQRTEACRAQGYRLTHVGNDGLLRHPRAGAQPGQRQRRAHDLEKIPARGRVRPLRGMTRKFAVQHLLEFGRLRQLFQAAPVLRSARWTVFRAPRSTRACRVYRANILPC